MMRLLLATLLCLSSVPALADEALPGLAVQNRKHTSLHEFTLSVGVLPMDAFTKGVTGSGAYTLHFNDVIAWEAVQFFYSFPTETDLKDELRAFDLKPTPFERIEQFVTSNLLFKPLYWKGAWLNQTLTYGEMYLAAGGGYGWLSRTQRPVVDAGVGFRFYLGELVSTRLDVRHVSFFNDADVHNDIWVGLGVSLSP